MYREVQCNINLMYEYIYLTTNKLNGKKYIGQHTSSCFDKSYLGSGTILKQAIARDGRDNFSCVILQECSSKEELNECEMAYISKYGAVDSDEYYNITPGGDGVPKGTPSPNKGKICPQFCIPCSDEKKEKIRESAIGRYVGDVWLYNPIEDKRVHVPKDKVDELLSNGYILGRNDPELYEKLSRMQKENPPCGMLGKKHSDETKKKMSDARVGMVYSDETKQRIRLGKLGKVLVSNEELNKSLYVAPDELETYLNNGYHRGRKIKH